MAKQRFDIHVQVRSSYKKPFGKQWLKLSQYFGLEGSDLVRKVFSFAEEMIAWHKAREAELEIKERELAKEKLRLKTGGI